jgi:hypothetical protein
MHGLRKLTVNTIAGWQCDLIMALLTELKDCLAGDYAELFGNLILCKDNSM